MDERLSEAELALWHGFKRMGEMVMERVGRDIQDKTGLSGADFGVLSRLEDLGGGSLRQQALANSMQWERSRLSHHLTRMEERGLVERREQPKGRATAISITEAGRAAISASRPVHAAAVRRHLLSHLQADEEAALLGLSLRLARQGPG